MELITLGCYCMRSTAFLASVTISTLVLCNQCSVGLGSICPHHYSIIYIPRSCPCIYIAYIEKLTHCRTIYALTRPWLKLDLTWGCLAEGANCYLMYFIYKFMVYYMLILKLIWISHFNSSLKDLIRKYLRWWCTSCVLIYMYISNYYSFYV